MSKKKSVKSKKPKAPSKVAKRVKAKKAKPYNPLLNIKADRKDRAELKAQAKKFMEGNLSGWLRFAGMRFRPTKSQLAAWVKT